MVSHRVSIKTVFKKLDREQPFDENEKARYSVKEQNLIRGIQLRDKTDKPIAIATYHNYELEGKRKLKSLNTSIRKYIKERYPSHGNKPTHTVKDFKQHEPKKKIKLQNKREVDKFLMNRDNYFKNEKVFKRIKNAQLKYPNASLQELRHGVNSKWSEEYRVKHGLDRNYK
jgi:hypothetical protein